MPARRPCWSRTTRKKRCRWRTASRCSIRAGWSNIAAPTEVYDKPSSLFVNTFVGTANTLPGKLVALNGEATVALDIGAEIRTRAPTVPVALGDRVTVCMRPEHLRLADGGEGLAGIVEMGLPLGPPSCTRCAPPTAAR